MNREDKIKATKYEADMLAKQAAARSGYLLGDTYNPSKALSEEEVAEYYSERHTQKP